MAPRSDGRRRSETGRMMDGVRALARRFSVSERADVSCCGMTVAQAATLEALLPSGGMRLGALGRRLGIRPSTLTRNLLRLEQRGLLDRIPDPGDARATRAVLTEAGRRAAENVAAREREFAESVLRRLPAARRRRALDGLDDLLAAVVEATEACCPGAFEHLVRRAGRPDRKRKRRKPA